MALMERVLTEDQRESMRSIMASQREAMRDIQEKMRIARKELLKVSFSDKFDEGSRSH
jgi:Spy/CpxP family protein refolding chaperone